MLEPFLSWWAEQMRDLLPRRWRQGGESPDALVIALRTPVAALVPAVALIRRRRRAESDLGHFILDEAGTAALRDALARQQRGPLALRLPAGVLLERQLVLPLLAEREAGQVLGYEMDRFTPFRSEELVWSWALERRDRARGRLHLRLTFATRESLRPLLEALARAGAVPTALEEAIEGGTRRIALGRDGGPGWQRRGLAAAAGVCAALAVAAVVLPFVVQQGASRAVERRFATLQPAVAQVERLRRELAGRVAGVDVFAADRARLGDPLEVLAALTDALPDDTFLTELSLRQGKLGLTGQSAAAAQLITALSADRVIRNPAFAAPVTRVVNGRADQFSIRADVAP